MRVMIFTVVGALAVATGANAGTKVPMGWVEIADSSTQFTHVQGENGWSYWFSTGGSSGLQPMQPSVFVNAGGGYALTVWAPSPTMGCESGVTVCHVRSWRNLSSGATGTELHGNSNWCCTPQSGRQDPTLRWDAPLPMPARVELFGQYAVVGGGDQPITLSLNGNPALVLNEQDFGTGGATIVLNATSLSNLTLKHERCTPFRFTLRVLTPDCNSNGIADVVEILEGSSSDTNGDGIPDTCQCTADLTGDGVVNGGDLSVVLGFWGTPAKPLPAADLNNDGIVDAADLAAILSAWGPCPS